MNRFIYFSIAMATGIANSRRQRRRMMFFLTSVSLVMLFVGMTLLWEAFTVHPGLFAIYWLVCGWLVICTLLLAVYDLLMVLRQAREEHVKAHKDIFGKKID